MRDKISYYEKETRLAYNAQKAESYKKQQTEGVSWQRFTTWRERLCVEKALKKCNLTEMDNILDLPCGTGILADILGQSSSSIIASDISKEMMNLACKDYNNNVNFKGFTQADITKMPFREGTFSCVITIGLMHRLPKDIRIQALREITNLSDRFVIVSYSIDSFFQRVKQWMMKMVLSSYQSAPSPVFSQDVMKDLKYSGLTLIKKFNVAPFLSAEIVLLLENKKNQEQEGVSG